MQSFEATQSLTADRSVTRLDEFADVDFEFARLHIRLHDAQPSLPPLPSTTRRRGSVAPRLTRTAEPRQPLGAACTWDHTDASLWQTYLRPCRRDAAIAGERQFESRRRVRGRRSRPASRLRALRADRKENGASSRRRP